MVLTQSKSHIVAVVFSEKLDRRRRRDDAWIQAAVTCGFEFFTSKQQAD